MSIRFFESLREFFINNKEQFEQHLLEEAVNVKDKIEEIHQIGKINLVKNAHTLTLAVIDERNEDLDVLAKKEGELWARASLTIEFKLEWIQSVRRTLWEFLYQYNVLKQSESSSLEAFFRMEKKYNDLIDKFLNGFFISYSKSKDDMLAEQRRLVESLSVPIIPVTATTGVLPLIGNIDEFRIKIMEEKVFQQISKSKIETIVLDLSGVAYVENDIIDHLVRIIDGFGMMGCKTVITGIRPEVAKSMVINGMSFEDKAESKGTLQSALLEFFSETQISN
ncbi:MULTISPECIES: STAS domain-containing protein [Bacillaceae]|uniref:STAS domain-containing protein n=1 Tax=Evansella alkalicola TaxID=745819 RepID=A0ABS6JS83_9BACI|nr:MULTISPECIES: STAS domain-containing protein [Bacillaceae]MBU9720931.1 STAS domain-containing protein [Bacillus alkalicola]